MRTNAHRPKSSGALSSRLAIGFLLCVLAPPLAAAQMEGVLQVTIDIKPGSYPNAINLDSEGVIPVAVFSSASFDATRIDPLSATLAGANIKSVGKDNKLLSHFEDLNGDGLLDFVCQFLVEQFVVQPGESTAAFEATTSEGLLIRGQDTVKLLGNTRPQADAGPNQTVSVGDTVQLDGSGSSDHNGDTLTFYWELASVPMGSATALVGSTSVNPTFTVDVPGTYVVQLIVNDGKRDSAPDTVEIATGNSRPVADAGPDQTAFVNGMVHLDGTASSDVDGNPLTFAWLIASRPEGSLASLDHPTSLTPAFVVDQPGVYVVQLIVNDGQSDSAPDSVTISTANSPPVANAGPDQTAFVNDTVHLDGGGSTDVDGDLLTFSWSFISRPEGSTASFDDPAAVNPEFTVDLPGVYVLQLLVNDGTVSSTDSVTVSTQNSPPVAEAGEDKTARLGESVSLDGSASFDPDGDILSFSWSMVSRPEGSVAQLVAADSVTPSFVVDKSGTYVVQLIVNDGVLGSEPDTLSVRTENSAPVADAGSDQVVPFGSTVEVNGGESHDPDHDLLTYRWSLIARPAGSEAVLENATSVIASFVSDQPGTYVAQLIVNDGTLDSAPDPVTITTANRPPIADAGPDQSADVGATVQLDASGSGDPDGDPLTYSWSLTTVPEGSAATLSDPSVVNPTFVADLAGTYVAQLIVNDGAVDSAADTVTITAGNRRPLAHAGSDQSERSVIGIIQLDGRGSSDPDDDPITYSWSILTSPEGHNASISNPTLAQPQLVGQVGTAGIRFITPGTYVLQLIVNDGLSDSAPDTVRIESGNSPPVAVAESFHEGNTVAAGTTVLLRGDQSYDPDDYLGGLTYEWIFNAKPVGSAATLSAANVANPTFEADLEGTYILQLVVNDGLVNSASKLITITTVNQPPIAHAGPDQADVFVGSTVRLDGSGSSDPDGHTLSFSWVFESRPASSAAILLGAGTATPTFVADRNGTYVVRLVVNDGFVDSAADTVQVSTLNRAPVASAGSDRRVSIGSNVALNGKGSSDADGDPLTFAWELVDRPAGSTAALANPTTATPSFVADVIGLYTVRLVVNDGTADSAPDEVLVTASGTVALALLDTALIGVGRSAVLEITLEVNAPSPGVNITVTSDDTGVLTVGAPNPVFIPAGTRKGSITLHGVSAGNTIVRALDTIFSEGTLNVPVTVNLINVPASLNVGLGQQTALPLTISPNPAPSGGVLISVVSANPGVIEVLTPTVTIPEGAISANATVRGVSAGSASVVAGNPGFSSASAQVTSKGELNILQASATFTPGFPTDITVRLESGGTPVAAPAPGISVTLTPGDPGCLAVTSPATIATGLVSTSVELHYGGTAALPCSTTLTANSAGLTSDAATVTVNPDPKITMQNLPVTVGAGLQAYYAANNSDYRLRAVLGGSEHGGVTLRIQSSNPAVALVSPNGTTAGTAYFDTFVPNGSTTVSYYVQGIEGTTGTVIISGSAPGFTDGTGTVQVVQSGLEIINLAATIGATAANDPFQVRVGVPNASGTALSFVQSVRVGGGNLLVTVTNSNDLAGQLLTLSGGAQSRGVLIPEGSSISAGTLVGGGIEFDPLETGGGDTTVEAASPGLLTTLAGRVSVTVGA